MGQTFSEREEKRGWGEQKARRERLLTFPWWSIVADVDVADDDERQ